MARFVFDKIVTGDEIKGIIQKDLGSAFRVEVKKNRIEVVQDASKGCAILLREKDGRTSVEPHGYMPSWSFLHRSLSGGLPKSWGKWQVRHEGKVDAVRYVRGQGRTCPE